MDAQWQPDPSGQHEYRWWDGQQWTENVSNQGVVSQSPMPAEPAPAADMVVPALGMPAQQSQFPQPDAAAQVGGLGQPGQFAEPERRPRAAGGSPGISGPLVDGGFHERDAEAIANQNSRMLRVRVGEPFLARQGSMVAYQGQVQFEYMGAGAAKALKRALTGEGLSLMRVSGQGDVFLANLAYDVHMLHINQSGISISGNNVLAFSAGLQWNVERVKGAGIAAGGLFNTTLRGTGWVAITTDGPPVVLNAAEAPTFADTNAVVAWSADLQTSLQRSFTASSLIGRGSGEAVQVTFQGHGFVIVQPSEGFQVAGQA